MTQNATLCRQAVDLVLTDPDYQLESGYEGGVASDQARWIGEEVILTYDWCWSSFTTTTPRRCAPAGTTTSRC